MASPKRTIVGPPTAGEDSDSSSDESSLGSSDESSDSEEESDSEEDEEDAAPRVTPAATPKKPSSSASSSTKNPVPSSAPLATTKTKKVVAVDDEQELAEAREWIRKRKAAEELLAVPAAPIPLHRRVCLDKLTLALLGHGWTKIVQNHSAVWHDQNFIPYATTSDILRAFPELLETCARD